jgi:hypothetical protein
MYGMWLQHGVVMYYSMVLPDGECLPVYAKPDTGPSFV